MIPVQGVCPRRQEARTDRCVHTCFSMLFTVTNRWKPPRVHWCMVDKPDVIHPLGGALFSLQKGRTLQHRLQDGWTWERYPERRKLTHDEQCVTPLRRGRWPGRFRDEAPRGEGGDRPSGAARAPAWAGGGSWDQSGDGCMARRPINEAVEWLKNG